MELHTSIYRRNLMEMSNRCHAIVKSMSYHCHISRNKLHVPVCVMHLSNQCHISRNKLHVPVCVMHVSNQCHIILPIISNNDDKFIFGHIHKNVVH